MLDLVEAIGREHQIRSAQALPVPNTRVLLIKRVVLLDDQVRVLRVIGDQFIDLLLRNVHFVLAPIGELEADNKTEAVEYAEEESKGGEHKVGFS